MQTDPFSAGNLTGSLDYLQRIGFTPVPLPANLPMTAAPPALRRLLHVSGIGRMEKLLPPHQRQAGGQPLEAEQAARMLSEDVLTGLYGYKIPLAFLVMGEPGGVAIHMGVWSPFQRENASADTLNQRERILSAVLGSLYPAIKLAPIKEVQLPPWQWSGLALGIPTVKPPEALDNALPLDRMIRALSDASWAFLVLAEPVVEQEISKLRNSVINETRDILTAYPTTTGGIPNPLAQHYTELLKQTLHTLTQGQALGAWRTAVYLLSENTSYYRLASLWRGIYSGDKSVLDPVRVWDSAEVAALAVGWAMPEVKGPPGSGHYRHPFQYQTLLTSAQLAAYVHLPQLETSGFTVQVVPDFDAAPPSSGSDGSVPSLQLGKVVHRTRLTQTNYMVSTNVLVRHAFVAGVTGAGKTNTIFSLLKQAAALNIPFLVIEPAKTEYRTLLDDPALAGRIRIFTLGNENISPLRLNPFEALAKTPVSVHLDLLRSVFSASFGMWTPLPQILEQCLYRVYQDRGWDITRDSNFRLDSTSDVAAAYPTLSDLVTKVDEVISQMGWDEKITSDMQASLTTRLNGLRTGGKGSMLDVQYSLPMEVLLEHPTILELEGVGDDDDKAFLMGLLLIRLVEYRRARGEARGLRHLLVIEEAHRLLANVEQRKQEEEANSRGKAVETFANLLSEVRAYGQGIIVADQIPVKLAPDVIKNTNLKIVHRTVAADDREVLAGAMAMNERQALSLATLTTGQAAVFSEGDDVPVLVQIPRLKDQRGWPDNARVKQYMIASKAMDPYKKLFQPLAGISTIMVLPAAYRAYEAARAVVDTPAFQREFTRFVVSITENDDALDRLWSQLFVRLQAVRQRDMDENALLRCVLIYASSWFAQRRGRQAGWSFAQTTELEKYLRQLLLTRLIGQDWLPALASLRALMHTLHARPFEPFPGCEKICRQTPPLCLYRHAVADIVSPTREALIADWMNTFTEEGPEEAWTLCKDMTEQLIEVHPAQEEAVRRIGLCYAQQMLEQSFPETRAGALEMLLEVVDLPSK